MILFFKQIVAIAYKDIRVELRSPVRLFGIFFFALALIFMVAFAAGSTTRVLQQIAGGTLWLGILLTSSRALDQSFAIELDEGALEELVLWPVEPAAIFYGKAIANALVLFVVSVALTPLVIGVFDAPVEGIPIDPAWTGVSRSLLTLLFDAPYVESLPLLTLVLALGCAALAAPGTLLAGITSRAKGSSVLLPLLLFPLVVPALMAAARGTTVVLEGDPMGQAPGWLAVLAIFNAIHWSVSGVLFRYVVEEA